MILVGHLRLSEHHTLDEVHQILSTSLQPFTLTISGREVMYLVRDVLTGPDGFLYVLLQNRNGDPVGGSIIRLVPAN